MPNAKGGKKFKLVVLLGIVTTFPPPAALPVRVVVVAAAPAPNLIV